jgi:hypothetical protein
MMLECGIHVPPIPPSFDSIVVPRRWSQDFVDAAAWFWEDVEYLHCNSLIEGNPSVSHRLAIFRQARAERPSR